MSQPQGNTVSFDKFDKREHPIITGMPLLKVPANPEKEIHFIGLLANADSSIMELPLQYGFCLQEMMDNRIARLMATLEQTSNMDHIWQLLWDFRCLNKKDRKTYVVSNSFRVDEYDHRTLPDAISEFEEKTIERYLNIRMRLLRLYKNGNICIPLRYYYIGTEYKPETILKSIKGNYIASDPFQIDASEHYRVHRFLHDNSLPFQESFLQLAFETYEQSYQTSSRIQTYLTLFSSLELLFYPPNNDQPVERIARNIGVLLGADKKKGSNIERDVFDLFSNRAHFSAHADSSIITKLDIIKLRTYVRESIKEFNEMGRSKQEAINILNSTGFGKRTWKTK